MKVAIFSIEKYLVAWIIWTQEISNCGCVRSCPKPHLLSPARPSNVDHHSIILWRSLHAKLALHRSSISTSRRRWRLQCSPELFHSPFGPLHQPGRSRLVVELVTSTWWHWCALSHSSIVLLLLLLLLMVELVTADGCLELHLELLLLLRGGRLVARQWALATDVFPGATCARLEDPP